ncbi:hypothetical protein HUW46_05069 [Amycolatopsis sp. CA-230715]|nr:nitrate- and nitrite sensing domain-containing protein [Amycolatopsis sp. CA-230715]QWF81636.1 hypothetical protein HUW46_05069 [Amycolatopsis sp. CA-230715]
MADASHDASAVAEAGGRWRLRNWRLRTKLLAVLLIPAITVVVLAGLHAKQDLDHADQLAELAARGRVDGTIAEVVHQLQRERDLTVRFVAGGRKADPAELRAQRDRVDAASAAFSKEIGAQTPKLPSQAVTALRQTESRLGVLTGLRFAGEHSAYPADAVLRSYSELISGLLDMNDQAVTGITDPDLARLRLAANALARVKDQMSIKRAVLAQALEQGSLSPDGTRALLGADAELSAARNDFRKFASPDQQRMYDDTVIGLIVDIGNDMVESALTRTQNDQGLAGLDPARWDTAATYTVNLARKVADAMQARTQAHTDTLAERARTSALVDGGIVLGALLLAAALAVVIARSLLRPLRVLRGSALEVAEHRLPEAVQDILADPRPENARNRGVAPVPVFTREELGQVARAFDAVHGEAVRLAGEQALLRENVNSMFVNLSRRSQNLVERQLSVLDRMEADEQDSETLGGLFELDHLATRMRRNSENLLVLSGTELDRVAPGPVAAEEIIGAALSEVEHYQRIELLGVPDLQVRGEPASDLVHVISELLENATLYSGEDTVVTVYGTIAPDASWHVLITDRGAGMPDPEIARANARLAEPPEVDVEVSRRMGLYVVARLARRHKITVRLAAADGGGLAATVVVPPSLLIGTPPVGLPAPELAAAAPEPVAVSTVLSPDAPAGLPLPQELPSLPVFSEPFSEPRRAPVESEPAPSWPEAEPYQFDPDEPTERMPAYQDLLEQWFAAAEQRVPDLPVAGPEPAPSWGLWEPEPEPGEPGVEPYAEPVLEPVVEPDRPAPEPRQGTWPAEGAVDWPEVTSPELAPVWPEESRREPVAEPVDPRPEPEADDAEPEWPKLQWPEPRKPEPEPDWPGPVWAETALEQAATGPVLTEPIPAEPPEPRWPEPAAEDFPPEPRVHADHARRRAEEPPSPRQAPEPEPRWPDADDNEQYREPGDKPVVSRAADAVRVRMASLQNGTRRGRHARTETERE